MDEFITPFLKDLLNPESTRLVISLIMFGYMMRMLPWMSNRLIPMVNCFFLGPLLSFIVMGWPANGEINPSCRWPELCAYLMAYNRGFLVGVMAWMTHGFVLKKIEEGLEKLGVSPSPPTK